MAFYAKGPGTISTLPRIVGTMLAALAPVVASSELVADHPRSARDPVARESRGEPGADSLESTETHAADGSSRDLKREPTESKPSGAAADSPSSAAKARLLREGDSYEAIGRFEWTGDRMTFYADGESESVRLLENLALERVARFLEESALVGKDRRWAVSGSITEYRGVNHLLLRRAVLKARSP